MGVVVLRSWIYQDPAVASLWTLLTIGSVGLWFTQWSLHCLTKHHKYDHCILEAYGLLIGEGDSFWWSG